jgi:diguanylate cyclase (GGDEF)-like protein
MKETIKFLKKVNIFSSLKENELEAIASLVTPVSFKKDNVIFNEGDEGIDLFIIEGGHVASSLRLPNGKQKELVVFESGNFFGEMAIFDNAPRSATCTARDESVLLKLSKSDFFNLMNMHPHIATEVMYRMLNITTQRLRNTSNFLTDMVRWGDDASRRAITDEITGAYNRRYLDNTLDELFITAKNSGRPLSIIMGDVDYFRDINEAYGHEVGDKTLIEVFKAFRKNLRQKDVLARYGGDEITVILPETPPDEARDIAETIRTDVFSIDVFSNLSGTLKKISASQGIANFPLNALDLKTLKEKADQALYQAKELGRNRVICCEKVPS